MSQDPLNPDHLCLARRVIESYLYQLSHKDEFSNWRSIERTTTLLKTTSENLLNFASISLNDSELVELLPEISKLRSVTVLDLAQSQITGEGVKRLLEFLPNIEQLDLSSCKLSINQGCLYLAKFRHLRFIRIANNNLQSSDIDQLRSSHSLLNVDYSNNPRVDIVSKTRLHGALAYNNQVTLQHGVGAKHTDSEDKKEEFIRLNFEKFRKEVQKWEKINADLSAIMSSSAPRIL